MTAARAQRAARRRAPAPSGPRSAARCSSSSGVRAASEQTGATPLRGGGSASCCVRALGDELDPGAWHPGLRAEQAGLRPHLTPEGDMPLHPGPASCPALSSCTSGGPLQSPRRQATSPAASDPGGGARAAERARNCCQRFQAGGWRARWLQRHRERRERLPEPSSASMRRCPGSGRPQRSPQRARGGGGPECVRVLLCETRLRVLLSVRGDLAPRAVSMLCWRRQLSTTLNKIWNAAPTGAVRARSHWSPDASPRRRPHRQQVPVADAPPPPRRRASGGAVDVILPYISVYVGRRSDGRGDHVTLFSSAATSSSRWHSGRPAPRRLRRVRSPPTASASASAEEAPPLKAQRRWRCSADSASATSSRAGSSSERLDDVPSPVASARPTEDRGETTAQRCSRPGPSCKHKVHRAARLARRVSLGALRVVRSRVAAPARPRSSLPASAAPGASGLRPPDVCGTRGETPPTEGSCGSSSEPASRSARRGPQRSSSPSSGRAPAAPAGGTARRQVGGNAAAFGGGSAGGGGEAGGGRGGGRSRSDGADRTARRSPGSRCQSSQPEYSAPSPPSSQRPSERATRRTSPRRRTQEAVQAAVTSGRVAAAAAAAGSRRGPWRWRWDSGSAAAATAGAAPVAWAGGSWRRQRRRSGRRDLVPAAHAAVGAVGAELAAKVLRTFAAVVADAVRPPRASTHVSSQTQGLAAEPAAVAGAAAAAAGAAAAAASWRRQLAAAAEAATAAEAARRRGADHCRNPAGWM